MSEPVAPEPTVTSSSRTAVLRERTVLAWTLLPLRFFLGITYVYAAFDKFASQHFFVAGDPFGVAAQMEGYARTSPLAPLIEASLPAAIPIGLLIALAELAIGLGLLTGLAYRLSAWAGFALSILFWLTASWSVAPYFFSPDLPYAFAFLTLALAGHGGLLVIDPAALRSSEGPGDVAAPSGPPASPARRALLQVGILAVLTGMAAVALAQMRALGAAEASGAATGAARTSSPTKAPATSAPTGAPAATAATDPSAPAATDAPPTAEPTTAPTAEPTAAPTAGGKPGPVIANVADLEPGTALPFLIPNEVPFAQNPGGPGVLLQLTDGRFVANSPRCTHGQCTVAFDQSVGEMICPCHLGRFDPADHAAVLGGPPPLPLAEIPVAVDATGQVYVVLPA